MCSEGEERNKRRNEGKVCDGIKKMDIDKRG
jgi:hypothetical protein